MSLRIHPEFHRTIDQYLDGRMPLTTVNENELDTAFEVAAYDEKQLDILRDFAIKMSKYLVSARKIIIEVRGTGPSNRGIKTHEEYDIESLTD